jgi:hypothetical protein
MRAQHQELVLDIGLLPSGKPKRVQAVVDEVLGSLVGQPLEETSFRALRTDATAQWWLDIEEPPGRAWRLAKHRDPAQPDVLWDEPKLRARLTKLRPADLQKAAARFAPPGRCLVVHANSDFKRSFTTSKGSLGFER